MVWPLVYSVIKIVCVVGPLILCVAYLTLWERKVIGWMHIRIGPNRVGPMGLLQPIADGLKLLLKEIVVPTRSNKPLFVIAPVMTIMPALVAWAVIPFGPRINVLGFTTDMQIADVNVGILFRWRLRP